jgi:hypothetical protein
MLEILAKCHAGGDWVARPASWIILLVVCFSSGALAADDFQLWTEAGVRYRVNKQFTLKFDQHFRYYESDVHEIMPELAVSYRPWKFLRFEAGYRFIAETPAGVDEYDLFHRFFVDARLRFRAGLFRFGYRLRYQEVFGWEGLSGSETFVSKRAIRNKLGVEMRLGAGFSPFFSTELFNRLDDSRRAWFKLRLTPGLEYRYDSHRFTLFYRMEVYLFDDTRGAVTSAKGDKNHVLGLGYHFSF